MLIIIMLLLCTMYTVISGMVHYGYMALVTYLAEIQQQMNMHKQNTT